MTNRIVIRQLCNQYTFYEPVTKYIKCEFVICFVVLQSN